MDKGFFGEKAERRRAGSSWNRDDTAWKLGAGKETHWARSPVHRQPVASDSSAMNAAAAGVKEFEAVNRSTTNGASQNIDASRDAIPSDVPQIELQVQKEEGYFRVKGSVETLVDPDILYSIITDYNSNARVFRNVDRVEVEQRGNEKIVTQFFHWNFLLWSGQYDVKMKVNDDPRSQSVFFELDQPGFLKVFSGSWKVEPFPKEGIPGASKLIVNQRALPSFFPPSPLAIGAGSIVSRIMSSQVRCLLIDVATEASKMKKNSVPSP